MVLRPARKADAPQLAVLMDIASQSLVSHVWASAAVHGQLPLAVGAARIATRTDLPSHFSRWTVYEEQSEICGAFAGYVIPDPYDPGDISELPATFTPLLELEDLAKGCWFLMALAVLPRHRRKGIGARLLEAAKSQAWISGATMALTVSNQNTVAKNIYLASGFHEAARRNRIPLAPEEKQDEWILLLNPHENLK
jgi:GNAT superfamily N-acetyltransferase